MVVFLNYLNSGLYNDATLAGYLLTNVVKVVHFTIDLTFLEGDNL